MLLHMFFACLLFIEHGGWHFSHLGLSQNPLKGFYLIKINLSLFLSYKF